MDPVEEIRNYFSSLNDGKVVSLKSFGNKYSSWAVKFNGAVGVAIEVNSANIINEKFSNTRFHTNTFQIEGTETHLLMLTSDVLELRYEFASLCAMFLDIGSEGREREKILLNPIKWWENLKELIGNRTQEKTAHSVLGELVVLYYLYSRNREIEWNGPKGASADIEDSTSSHEVKSTLMRYDTIVEIPGPFQLADKQQFLYFCRFEKSETGLSINSVGEKVIKLGYPEPKIEDMLNRIGFEKNSLVRSEKFKLLELKKYTVDENFPVLKIDEIYKQKMADHIVRFWYALDLKGLHSEPLIIDSL